MKQKLFDKFAELFGNSDGVNFYFSPGRVNLIGEHTDYNGGHVFPCALTLGTYGAARKREDRKIHFYSMNLDSFGVVEASLDDLTNKKEYNWANYPLGVVWAFAEKGHPISSGFDMVIWGNIPNGSGLSSSASLEVLTGVILSAPNIVTPEMVASMNQDAILFAMANPVPEIMPDLAKAAGAKVVGTGRSDFPNQVNNVVAFPGIFKGALEGRATQITEEMKLAAANAIAGLVPEEELNENNILPEAFDPRVAETVSKAIKDLI
jgi:hypothetical protein